MRRLPLLIAALVGAAFTPVHANAAQLVVGFTPASSALDRAAALREARAPSGIELPRLDAHVIQVSDAAAPAVRRALTRRASVRYVETDATARAAWTPNDPYRSNQWGLARIGATTAWDSARGDGVLIADVDSGVDYRHPDLAGKVVLGPDFVAGDSDPMDEHGHGTHVAGIAAAITDNGTGIAGTAPEARILAVRVLDANGSGYMSNIARGITYSVDNGARVVNLSLGGSSGSTALQDAINYAVSKGAILTCAAGNDAQSSLGYPARYDGCTAVGATDSSDARASFSNYGTGLDLVAPGVGILSSVRGTGYSSWNGTSMATPYVSGLSALLFSQGLSRSEALSRMTSTATDLGASGYDTTFGHGRIDAASAVIAATRDPEPQPTPNAAPTCTSTSVTVRRNRSRSITLTCSDPGGTPLSFAVATKPRYGTLSSFDAMRGTVTYTPYSHYRGSDSFTFTASDGAATSAAAKVSIVVS